MFVYGTPQNDGFPFGFPLKTSKFRKNKKVAFLLVPLLKTTKNRRRTNKGGCPFGSPFKNHPKTENTQVPFLLAL